MQVGRTEFNPVWEGWSLTIFKHDDTIRSSQTGGLCFSPPPSPPVLLYKCSNWWTMDIDGMNGTKGKMEMMNAFVYDTAASDIFFKMFFLNR